VSFLYLRIGPLAAELRSAMKSCRTDPSLSPFLSAVACRVNSRYEFVPSLGRLRGRTEKLLWDSPAWRLSVDGGGRNLIDVQMPRTRLWRRVAETGPCFEDGRIVPCGPGPGGAAPAITGSLSDRIVFSNRLFFLGALVLHASVVELEGRGLVFCGPSEIGKSTIAGLWVQNAAARLLNDDRAIVFARRGRAIASAAPWHGKNPDVDSREVPLAAVFHLSQATRNRVRPLDEGEAAAALLAASAAPLYHPEGAAAALDNAVRTAQAVPSYRLAFRPDRSVVEYCIRRISSDAG